ncbi:MAG TPA: S9 family peptidase, partial [Steroidobacteraceae bacterium]|nr:S9 family peptidase [Steroidobacteraceae bacterium]
ADDARPFDVDDLVRLARVTDPVVSPDGRLVVYTVSETDLAANRRRTDLWLLDLQAPDAGGRRLTSHPENDSQPRWAPDGRTIYFLSARSGKSQVWRLPLTGGEAQPVTEFPVDVTTFAVAPDGRRIAFTANVFPECADFTCTARRLEEAAESPATGVIHDRLFARHWDQWNDGRVAQLFAVEIENGRASAVPVPVSGSLDAHVPSRPFGDASDYTFSPDGTRLVFSARLRGRGEPWSTNFDLYEAPADGSGEPVNLTAGNPAWDAGPVFSPDGTLLAWRAMSRAGFEADRFGIRVRDLESGETRSLADDWDRSAGPLAFSPDGKTIYTATDHFGQHPLWAVEVKSGRTQLLTGPGRVEAFSVADDRVIASIGSLTTPAELFAIGLRKDEIRQLTRTNADALASVAFGRPEQFTFAGADGATVYGYVVTPAQFDPSRRYPVAFIVHGGPQGSFGNAWSYRWNPQTYAGAGYAVVFIDFHGSTGYGQAFTDAVSGDWGGKPLEDLRKGLAAALERYPWLDADRVCALGASYGGYMVNWIAGNWHEPFRCFVNHAGLFDLESMYYSTEELWFPEWEFGGPAFAVPENYQRHNPANDVTDWRKPMLVIHGLKDFRVPYTQGLMTYTALERQGIDSRLLIFPDENHWILKPANSVQWHREVKRWLDEWLGESSSE